MVSLWLWASGFSLYYLIYLATGRIEQNFAIPRCKDPSLLSVFDFNSEQCIKQVFTQLVAEAALVMFFSLCLFVSFEY